MPSLTTFVTYLALVLTTLPPLATTSPTPSLTSRNHRDSTNPHEVSLRPANTVYRRDPELRTNAERFRRGLGPLPPKRLQARSHLEARQSSSPAPACQSVSGVIGAAYTDDVGTMYNGYISSAPNIDGEYRYTSSKDSALRISICTVGDGPFEISTLNGDSAYPYLGAFKGYAATSPDLGTGSFNYLYLGGTSHTGPSSSPVNDGNSFTAATGIQEPIESTIWSFGPNSALSILWVNTDSSIPANTIVYIPSADGFAVTGDVNAFRANFGSAPTVLFTFVPDN